MLVKEALKITDSFTKTSKMPGLSYSLRLGACSLSPELLTISNGPGKPGPLVLLDVDSRDLLR